MRLKDWYSGTVKFDCLKHKKVICVCLPFIRSSGVMEKILPEAKIHYLSAIPCYESETPDLSPQSSFCIDIPFLELNTVLVKAYWASSKYKKAWAWLEEDFSRLQYLGFDFECGKISEYIKAVRIAASQFCIFVESRAAQLEATAIIVYGRGHWSMNAGAVAASHLKLPIYVVERGILPDTYIIDKNVPFPASMSNFREKWEQFLLVKDAIELTQKKPFDSRWDLYIRKNNEIDLEHCSTNAIVLAGQCSFDFNLITAPFKNAKEFIEYAITRIPQDWQQEKIIYRPHPLSLEDYPNHTILTSFGEIPIEWVEPKYIFEQNLPVCSWNSTLGLESLLLNGRAIALDSKCYYKFMERADISTKNRFISFLHEISINTKD